MKNRSFLSCSTDTFILQCGIHLSVVPRPLRSSSFTLVDWEGDPIFCLVLSLLWLSHLHIRYHTNRGEAGGRVEALVVCCSP